MPHDSEEFNNALLAVICSPLYFAVSDESPTAVLGLPLTLDFAVVPADVWSAEFDVLLDADRPAALCGMFLSLHEYLVRDFKFYDFLSVRHQHDLHELHVWCSLALLVFCFRITLHVLPRSLLQDYQFTIQPETCSACQWFRVQCSCLVTG